MGDPYIPEKSKYFTRVIYKESVLVTIQLKHYQIQGYLHVRPDDRIIDELDREEKFVAVTDASVLDAAGSLTHKHEIMIVNREQILWVVPIEDQNESNPEEVSK